MEQSLDQADSSESNCRHCEPVYTSPGLVCSLIEDSFASFSRSIHLRLRLMSQSSGAHGQGALGMNLPEHTDLVRILTSLLCAP